MEKLTDISQLKQGDRFTHIGADGFNEYEFLCIHPHNPAYILAIDGLTQNAPKLYINDILEYNSGYYVGKFDSEFVTKKRIEMLKERISRLENRL
jgi:hypothetical protein